MGQQEGSMRDTLRRVMYSRVAWFLGVIGWVWIASGLWYEGLSEGFTTLKVSQVVIATSLAVVFSGAFVLNRGWRKRNDDAR